jgi:hypothetical protein
MEIFFLTRILIVENLSALRRTEDLFIRKRIFDSENILRIGMDRLAEKITYFNNYYIYRAEIGTRIKSINEFNNINVDTAEYADIINNRFNIFIDLNTDSLLISINERKD